MNRIDNCNISKKYAYAYFNTYVGTLDVPADIEFDYREEMSKLEKLDEMERWDIPYYPDSDMFFSDPFIQAVCLERFPGCMNKYHTGEVSIFLKAFEILSAK